MFEVSKTELDLLKKEIVQQSKQVGPLSKIALTPDSQHDRIICRLEPTQEEHQAELVKLFKGRKIGSSVYFHIPYSF